MKLRHVQHDVDRHGNERWYYRRPGRKKIRLPPPGSPEFAKAYLEAQASEATGTKRLKVGSVSAGVGAYYQHNSFTSLAPSSQQLWRAILERFRERYGALSIATMRQQDVAVIIGTKKPFAARNWLKALRALMQFAIATGLRQDDPTAGVKLPRAKSDGFHTWTEAEIAQFEAYHAPKTRPHLAMALLLYTAARRSDIVLLGPQHIRQGVLSYRQKKTKRLLHIPVHPKLAAVLCEIAPEHLTFLTTRTGSSYTAHGFGNLFKQWCCEAGLPHCSAHGLRKAQCRRLAEAGCSAPQIAAISGHATLAHVQRYIEGAEQALLAQSAIRKVAE